MLKYLLSRPLVLITLLYVLAIACANLFFNTKNKELRPYCDNKQHSIMTEVLGEPKLRENSISFQARISTIDGQSMRSKALVRFFSKYFTATGGDLVGIEGSIKEIRAGNEAYYARKGIYHAITAKNITIVKPFKEPLYRRAANILRADVLKTFHDYLPDREAGILSAMIIGEKSEISPEDTRYFQDSGTMHLLVVSGLNVGYVSLVIFVILRLLGFSLRTTGLVSIPLLLLFMAASGINPPVVRATLSAIYIFLAFSLERDVDYFIAISISALVSLLYEPGMLFDISFQLSYISTLGIVYMYPKLRQMFGKKLNWFMNFTASNVSLSMSAQLAVMPLIAVYFNRLNFAGFISNIAAVPLSAVITAAGVALYLANFVSASIAVAIAFVIKLSLYLLLTIVSFFARLDIATLNTAAPPMIAIIAFYAALVVAFSELKRRYLFGVVLLALTICLLFAPKFTNTKPAFKADSMPRCETIYLNGKQSVLVLIKHFGFNDEILINALRKQGINKLDYAITIENTAVRTFRNIAVKSAGLDWVGTEIKNIENSKDFKLGKLETLHNLIISVEDQYGVEVFVLDSRGRGSEEEILKFMKDRQVSLMFANSTISEVKLGKLIESLQPERVIWNKSEPKNTDRIKQGVLYLKTLKRIEQ